MPYQSSKSGSPSIIESMQNMRADYASAKDTRFRRFRPGVMSGGTSADWHMRNESDLFRMVELSRALVRDDIIIGPSIEKTVDHIVQGGFTLMPKFKSKSLNDETKERFDAWAVNADRVDRDGEMDWRAAQRQVIRAAFRDGEIFPLLHKNQQLSLVETQRVRRPTNSRNSRNIFGIQLAKDSRRRVQFWITKDEVNPFKQIRILDAITKVDVRDPDTGLRVALQVYDPKRVSQTRCPPVLQPVIDTLSQIDDTLFAKLVQQQATSVFAFIREREAGKYWPGSNQSGGKEGSQAGEVSTETLADGSVNRIEKFGPAMEYKAPPGEKITAFSPNIPSPQFFEHVKLMLQLVNIHLHLPLVIYLLDASETNFSGWRGAVDAARDEYRRVQEWLVARFHRHVALWWIAAERGMNPDFDKRVTAEVGPKFAFPHKWNPPVWKYIQPLDDAKAHALRRKTLQVSPRDGSVELGKAWNNIVAETVEDNSTAVTAAVKAADAINKSYPEARVTWREILSLPSIADVDVTKTAPTTENPIRTAKGNTNAPST